MGHWLAQNGYRPDLVLSSDSERTRETWALMSGAFAQAPRVEWCPALYLGAAQDMLEVLRGAKAADNVLMLGHNPGIARFADMLVQRAPDHMRFRDYPTGATSVISFPMADWGKVDWGTGTALAFVTPKDI